MKSAVVVFYGFHRTVRHTNYDSLEILKIICKLKHALVLLGFIFILFRTRVTERSITKF